MIKFLFRVLSDLSTAKYQDIKEFFYKEQQILLTRFMNFLISEILFNKTNEKLAQKYQIDQKRESQQIQLAKSLQPQELKPEENKNSRYKLNMFQNFISKNIRPNSKQAIQRSEQSHSLIRNSNKPSECNIKNRTIYNPNDNNKVDIMQRRSSLNNQQVLTFNQKKQNNGNQLIANLKQQVQNQLSKQDPYLQKIVFKKMPTSKPVTQRETPRVIEKQNFSEDIYSFLIHLIINSRTQTLDEYFVSQFPSNNSQFNIIYLLQKNINKNQINMMHLINQNVKTGFIRLVKLLKENLGIPYTNSKKINQGAFGVIFQANFTWSSSKIIIKTWTKPQNIYDRNVIFDIFNEIKILDDHRLNKQITYLYDFGVNKNDYYVILKKYKTSLKEWRQKQSQNFDQNLQVYMKIYNDILKIIKNIHSNSITHYDLKADNIFLDIDKNNIHVALGDFGESKVFSCPAEEINIHNKGTEFIKSPEMLLSASQNKEFDDRRKKKGTSRACDIWALGCLFYEILTTQFLYYNTDWIQFYNQVINNAQVLTEEQCSKLNNNQYLIDFIRFVLVKDPNYRPNIDNVIERFDHIMGIICKTEQKRLKIDNLEEEPQNIKDILQKLKKVSNQIESFNGKESFGQVTQNHLNLEFYKIMNEIYYCSNEYFLINEHKMNLIGIDFVIEIKDGNVQQKNSLFNFFIDPNEQIKLTLPKMFDFIRFAIFKKGKIAFLYNKNIEIKNKIEQYIFVIISILLRINLDDCNGLLNSKLISLYFSNEFMNHFGKFIQHYNGIQHVLRNYPIFSCACRTNQLILIRKYNIEKNVQSISCSCEKNEKQTCPSGNCQEYITMTNVKQQQKNLLNKNETKVKWGYFTQNDFLYASFQNSEFSDEMDSFLHISQGMNANTEILKNRQQIQINKNSDVKVFLNIQVQDWVVYRCKVCGIWMYAQNLNDLKISLNMNNQIQSKPNYYEMVNQNLNKVVDYQSIEVSSIL